MPLKKRKVVSKKEVEVEKGEMEVGAAQEDKPTYSGMRLEVETQPATTQPVVGPVIHEPEPTGASLTSEAESTTNAPMQPVVIPETSPGVSAQPVMGGEVHEEEVGAVEKLARIPSEPVIAMDKPVKEKRPKNLGWLWVIVAFLAGVALGLGGGYMLWGKTTGPIGVTTNGRVDDQPKPTSAVEEPTPVPTVSISRTDVKVRVLNGSGASGVAAEAKSFLENLGYVEVTTGNADRSDYEETEIRVKSGKTDHFNLLQYDLGDEYTVASEAGKLEDTSPYDVVVIIGAL